MARRRRCAATLQLMLCFVWFGCNPGSPVRTSPPTRDIAPGPTGLRLLAPVGGESYTVGDTMTIRWSVDFDKVIRGVQFGFSTSDGKNWAHIMVNDQLVTTGSPLYDGSVGQYRYVLPAELTDDFGNPAALVNDSCWVKVLAPYDMIEGESRWIEDVCAAPVTITASAAANR